MNDLRYTFRMLRKTPLFTAAVVLTVALGIGATTAIFTVVNAVMLRPLPYADPDRLVWVAERNDRLNLATFSASVLNYLSWKEQTHSFDALGAVGFASFNLTGPGRARAAHRRHADAVDLSAAGRGACRRPRLRRRRGSARRRAGRDDQRRVVAAAIRRGLRRSSAVT